MEERVGMGEDRDFLQRFRTGGWAILGVILVVVVAICDSDEGASVDDDLSAHEPNSSRRIAL